MKFVAVTKTLQTSLSGEKERSKNPKQNLISSFKVGKQCHMLQISSKLEIVLDLIERQQSCYKENNFCILFKGVL